MTSRVTLCVPPACRSVSSSYSLMERKPVKRGVTFTMRTTMYTSFTTVILVGVAAIFYTPMIRGQESCAGRRPCYSSEGVFADSVLLDLPHERGQGEPIFEA